MALVGRARGLFRSGIRITARDVTAEAATRSALVIAPHPADETLGCGVTIRRKVAAGSRVTLLMVTDGEHGYRSRFDSSEPGPWPKLMDTEPVIEPMARERRRDGPGAQLVAQEVEPVRMRWTPARSGDGPVPDNRLPATLSDAARADVAEAARRLGVTPGDVRWAGLRAGTVAAHEDRLGTAIGDLIAEVRPDEVYVTCADEVLADHAATGRAARRAVRLAADPVRLLEYPVWLWASWPLRRGSVIGSAASAVRRLLRRKAVAVRTGDQLTPKWHALQAYAAQLHRPPGLPVEYPWARGLPSAVLVAAADRYEVFFPVRTGG